MAVDNINEPLEARQAHVGEVRRAITGGEGRCPNRAAGQKARGTPAAGSLDRPLEPVRRDAAREHDPGPTDHVCEACAEIDDLVVAAHPEGRDLRLVQVEVMGGHFLCGLQDPVRPQARWGVIAIVLDDSLDQRQHPVLAA
jgi:hypothetical protein